MKEQKTIVADNKEEFDRLVNEACQSGKYRYAQHLVTWDTNGGIISYICFLKAEG